MDEVFKATFEDTEIMQKLDNLEKQIIEISKRVDTLGDTAAESLNQAADAAGNFTSEMDSAATQTAKQAKAVENARAANQGWLQSIRQTIAGQQVAGRSLGEWAEQGRIFSNRIGDGIRSTTGLTGAWRLFNGVLKVSGIGLLVGIIASVIRYFTSFQSGIDKVSRVMASLNAVVEALTNRFLEIGTAIATIFGGIASRNLFMFKKGIDDLGDSISGFGDEVANAAVQAFNLEKRLQALRDVTITQSVEAARARVELDKFRQIVDDGTQSIGARIAAANQAGNIEKELAAQAVDRALEAQQIAQAKFALDKENLAAREEAAKAEIDFQEAVSNLNKANFDAEKEVRQLRKEAADERRKQQEEELKKADALRKEYEKLFADIEKQAAALNIENTFNPVERVIKQYQAAIDQTKALRERLLTIAPGETEKAKVEEAIGNLFDEIAIKYREELDKAEDELNKLKGGKIREALNPLPPAGTIDDDLKFRAKSAIEQLQAAAQEAIDAQQPRTLAQILGISEEGLEGLKDAAGQIINSLEQIADARVKEADAAVDAAERKVSAAQDALIRQQELAKQGVANDTDLAKKQLDEAKKAQEQAEKDRAKAVRSQILLDSVGQLSSLITASANIFKSLSSIPFAGIPLAIATIGVMFGAFAKAKSDALKAASVPKFRKGGKLEGPAHEYGGIAISDSEGNVYGEAEGGEWVVNRKDSNEQDKFLKRVNAGEFAGVDLDRVFRPSASNPLSDAAPRIARIEEQRREMETTLNMAVMATAYEKTAAQIVQAIKEQPEIYPLTNYKVKRRKGRNTYTEIVRQDG